MKNWWQYLAPALAATTLLLVPPYFGVDAASPAFRHAALGHRFRWAPPTAEEVCDALLERAGVPPGPSPLACPPPAARRPDLQARVNVVRLGGELGAVFLAGAGWWLIGRRRAG